MKSPPVSGNYVEFENVTKTFGNVPVIQETSLVIAPNSLVVFLGPSGCGKTTLMRMVGGLDKPTSGTIRIKGEPVTEPGRRTGMVFQSYSSFPWLTVAGNIAFGMRYRKDLSQEQRTERVNHYLRLIGLEDFADSYPNRISGGMRQRVAIARSLAAGPDVLLMDEPFGALDALTREKLQVELRQIQAREMKTIIFVTHDVEEAVFLADRIVMLSSRPASIVADIDVAGVLGGSRPLAIRESEIFFKLRNEVLRLVRHEAGDAK
ncbi:MAG TPA: ABC transporter ATP-binding protein [Aestuariivirgaceae bacterium]|jgi:ABC-type nitrate/sulfonate/bicarbonate transport system ATPase subunit